MLSASATHASSEQVLPIRQLVAHRHLFDRAFREQTDEWWSKRLDIPNFTPRYALQYVGTDVLRTHFHPDIWVAACERQVQQTEKNVVISDCRFFNELDAIQNMGGRTVVVWREEKPEWWHNASELNHANYKKKSNMVDSMKSNYPDVHKSEWSWAGWDFDLQLDNNSTLESFKTQTISKIIE